MIEKKKKRRRKFVILSLIHYLCPDFEQKVPKKTTL